MLIVARRTHQKIIISDDIEITILDISRNRVRFGIKAPKEVSIQTKLRSLPEQESSSEDTSEDRPPVRAVAATKSNRKR